MKGFYLCLYIWLISMTSVAQNNVGIGTTSPASSAKLEVSSTSQGFLPPRMTFAQRNAIANPVAGLMIWCTNCISGGEMQIYSGSAWMKFSLATASVPMEVGAPFGGGIIAYIFQPGDPGYTPLVTHGLIAAPSDQAMDAEWGCFGDETGANATALGSGADNTQEIVGDCAETGIAARICSDLVLNTYSDWYLPSKDELNKLYINRTAIGGFTQNNYWSSSEVNESEAWIQSFFTGEAGEQLEYPKLFDDPAVRAIRSF